VEQVIAAAKTDVATLINLRLIDPSFPLGRAMNLASCQENFCANECFLPSPSAPCPVIDFCHGRHRLRGW
jgi:hypothetical protein